MLLELHHLPIDLVAPRPLAADYATYGQLLLDGRFEADTLEPAVPDLEPGIAYDARLYHSPRFRRLVLRLVNVPGHDGIELHNGSFAADTRACVLVGGIFRLAWDPHTGRQETILSESRDRFNSFMAEVVGRLARPDAGAVPLGEYAPMRETCQLTVLDVGA